VQMREYYSGPIVTATEKSLLCGNAEGSSTYEITSQNREEKKAATERVAIQLESVPESGERLKKQEIQQDR